MDFRSKAFVSLLALASLALFSPFAAAQTETWGGSNGNWNVSADWTSGTVPGSGTNALIDSGTANLPASVSGAPKLLTVGESGIGVLMISGGSLTDSESVIGDSAVSSGTVTVNGGSLSSGTLYIGNSGFGTLNLTAGTITGSNAILGNAAGAFGTAVVSGGTWDSSGTFIVGNSGTGSFTFNGGSMDIEGGLVLGNNAAGSGTAVVTGGTYYSYNDTLVGAYGTGALVVSGRADFTAWDTRFGFYAGSLGSGTVSGGTLASQFYLDVGGGGPTWGGGAGSLLINGGYVSSGVATVIGDYAQSSGTIMITSGTLFNSGSLEIGNRSSGVLNLQGGTVVSTSNAIIGNTDLSISGAYGTASGTMNISGGTFTGSANLMVGTTSGTTSGTGVLNITGGHVSDVNGILGTGTAAGITGGGATANISSGTWINSGSLIVGGQYSTGGTMNVTGGHVTASALAVGLSGSSVLSISGSGVVNVGSGTGTVSLVITGPGGGGVLNMGDGGTLQAQSVTTNGTAAVNFNIAGSGSFGPSLSGPLNVTKTGTGTEVMLGIVNTNFMITLSAGTLQIGNGSSGAELVDNAGVRNSGTLIFDSTAGSIMKNIFGTGSVRIMLGVVSMTGLNLYSGSTVVNSGTLNAGGASASLAGNLVIGNNGGDFGVFSLTSGSVGDFDSIFGNGSGAVGSGTVLGGIWNSSDGLFVGNSGTGTLNILGTGVVGVQSGSGTVTLASGTSSKGTLNFGGGSLNAAMVTTGSGSGVVNFTGTSGTNTFVPQIAGTTVVNQTGSATTVLTGSSAYTGPTTVTAGALSINGSIASAATVSTGTLNGSGSTGNVSVNSGGVLAGTLSSGTVAVNSGTLAPGNNAPGVDNMLSLSIGTGAVYQATIVAPNSGNYTGPENHPVAGSDYTHTVLTGAGNTLTLDTTLGAGSILQLNLSGTLPPGGIGLLGNTFNPLGGNSNLDNYFILSLGGGSITGEFAQASSNGSTPINIDYSSGNLVGGANGDGSFTLNGQDWIISYTGNSAANSTNGGDDVVLTAVQPVPALSQPWLAALALVMAGISMLGGYPKSKRFKKRGTLV